MLTVDVQLPRVFDLAGHHLLVLGPALEVLAHVGDFRRQVEDALRKVSLLAGLWTEESQL